MILLNQVNVFLHKNQSYSVDAVQGETGRGLLLRLYDGAQAWEVPAGAKIQIRFRKPDGTGGIYDTLPDGSGAWQISGSEVTVSLAPQVLTVVGEVQLQVVVLYDGMELSTFTLSIHVQADPSLGTVESEDYVNLAAWITDSITSQLRSAEDSWHRLFAEGTAVDFTQGTLSQENGAEEDSQTEIRSEMMVLGGRAISAVFPSEVMVRCFFYDRDGVFLSCSEAYSESFTMKCGAANVRVAVSYQDGREVTDSYGLSQSIGISFPSDRHDSFRGNVISLGFGSFAECLEDGCYGFTEADVTEISDAPEIDCGGVLAVQLLGTSEPAMQTIQTVKGEKWFRVGSDPFVRIPALTAADVGAMPALIPGEEEEMIAAEQEVLGKIAWDTSLTGGMDHAEGQFAIFPVAGLDSVIIRGYQWVSEYGYYGYVFYDDSGAAISKHYGEKDSAAFMAEETVPKNAATVRVNGHIQHPLSVSVREMISVQETVERVAQEQGRAPKLMVLGDSITQLGTTDRGWVKYFLEATGCSLITNTAVIGATLKDKAGTVYDGAPVYDGADANVNNVLGNQVQKIINDACEAPDIIMIAIGTNDGISITEEDMTGAYYGEDGTLISLDQVDRTTSAGAYRYCLDTLHGLYPDAVIFWCTPIMAHHELRQPPFVRSWAESLRIATEYTGQILIDTVRCGINGINEVNGGAGEFLADGLHPNANGAMKIGYYNASKVMPYIKGLHVKG